MRYWDASALVPLIIEETDSELVCTWLSEDEGVVTWAWSRAEATSAIERRTREGKISRSQRRQALERLDAFSITWDEIADVVAVRSRAEELLSRHPLRAADAGQLSAALLLQEYMGSTLSFACLDQRLRAAALREGLEVLV